MVSSLLLLLALPATPAAEPSPDRFAGIPALSARIDARVERHWQESNVRPSALTDDSTFLRRLTLDLAGRIPTVREAQEFASERSPDKRARAIRRLMEGPEYALNMGRILDQMIQDKFAGDSAFVEYLRVAVGTHKPWDEIFRDIILGPWDTKERQGADRFLARRLTSLDDLTNDTARVFFGVNVSCAKCHDHPLVSDWKQDHYYGMASFFNRTQVSGKGKKGAMVVVMEKPDGDVMFVTTKGERRTAKLMFLSSTVIDEAALMKTGKGPPVVSRREQLVKIALRERQFFSKAIVNRLWAYFVGRGLVHPVDQMHSANPPSVPGLLEDLAQDLADHHYDLDRLIAGLLSSRVYQLDSRAEPNSADVSETHFARAALRPLTPEQYAFSLLLATGDETFDQAREPQARARAYRDCEGCSTTLTRPQLLDPRSDRFQSSTGEALFLSNHPEVQRLVAPAGNNLVSRLAALGDTGRMVDTAVWTVLSRAPEAEERAFLVRWLAEHKQEGDRACSQLVWALMTSAEFRFNH
jgi:hypothetical protein